MELYTLFSLLEGIVENIPQAFYDKLSEKMKARTFHDTTVLLEIGEPIEYFYYLKKGIASGIDNKGNTAWFCESNEIIMFDEFSFKNTLSSYEITIEKNSTIYQISMKELYEVTDKKFIMDMISLCAFANRYFSNLNAEMKSRPLKHKVKTLLDYHKQFVNARLDLVSAFLGASVSRISAIRKQLQLGYS